MNIPDNEFFFWVVSLVIAICGIILAVSAAVLEGDYMVFVFGMAAATLANLGGICMTIVDLLDKGDE